MSAPNIRVLVADDHELVRDGLVLMLGTAPGIEVVAQASNGEQCVASAGAHQPDVVLMDLKMPGMDGLAATQRIKARWPQTKVLLLTGVEDGDLVMEAPVCGADGYLLKSTTSDDLIGAIRTVAGGDAYLAPALTRQLFSRLLAEAGRPAARNPGLSEREIEVLRLMARLHSNREIADWLVISQDTVRSHVKNILRKLEQPDRTQAVLAGVRLGLIEA
ncbi:MAG: response regulator transcription factor [Chloroflexota bacterium]|nr:response regulator transcription factor [Chloroflexota bacterium]